MKRTVQVAKKWQTGDRECDWGMISRIINYVLERAQASEER